jgi:hypothetical protein
VYVPLPRPLQLLEELVNSFSNALSLVDTHLLPAATNSKARVYALKLRADCCRYWAEETSGEEKHQLAERSQYAYQQAWVRGNRDSKRKGPLTSPPGALLHCGSCCLTQPLHG